MSTFSKDNTGKALIAGCFSGICQISISYPIKLVKTELQLEEKLGKGKKYNGVIDCIQQTIKNHGILGLYRGLNVFLYGARSATTFAAFETLKTHYVDKDGKLSPKNRFLCGLFAGAFEAAVVNTPLEAVECKLIDDRRLGRSRFKGFLHGAVLIVKEEGVKSLYTGLFPSVLKQSGNQGIRFFVVGTLKSLYQKDNPNTPVPKIFVGFFGMVGGFISVFVTNPIDVVKTRMQGLNYKKYKNTIDCFIKICQNEGFYSFYRGVSPRLIRVCMEVSATFMFYEIFTDFLKLVI